MKARNLILIVVAIGTLLPTGRTAAEKDDGIVSVTPEQVVWTERPGFEGVKFANIAGVHPSPASTSSESSSLRVE
jgi:hypothetical protein